MIYKTTDCESIIAKVILDFNLQSNNWKTDAIEWIADGLGAIGHSGGLEKVYGRVRITGHRGALPCGLISIRWMEHGNIPLSTGSSLRSGNYSPVGNAYNSYTSLKSEFTLVNLDTSEVEEHEEHNYSYTHINPYAELNPDYIMTSFEKGWVTIYFTRYKLDSKGYPAVPDTYPHREALAFYVLYKWLARGNKHSVWDLKSSFDSWNYYREKAQRKAIFPSIQNMEAFKSMWTRIVPSQSLPSSSFIGGNTGQQINGI